MWKLDPFKTPPRDLLRPARRINCSHVLLSAYWNHRVARRHGGRRLCAKLPAQSCHDIYNCLKSTWLWRMSASRVWLGAAIRGLSCIWFRKHTHTALCQPHAVKIVAHQLARICRLFLVSFPVPCTTMEQSSSGPTKDSPIPASGIGTDTLVEYFTRTCEKYVPILFDIGEYWKASTPTLLILLKSGICASRVCNNSIFQNKGQQHQWLARQLTAVWFASEFERAFSPAQTNQTTFPRNTLKDSFEWSVGLHQSDHELAEKQALVFFIYSLSDSCYWLKFAHKKTKQKKKLHTPRGFARASERRFWRLEINRAFDGSILSTSSRRAGSAPNEERLVLDGSRKSQQDEMRGSD